MLWRWSAGVLARGFRLLVLNTQTINCSEAEAVRFANCVQHNLLMVDISNVLPDLVEVDDRLHQILRYSLQALLGKDPVPDAA